jgi:Trypsin
MTPHIMTQQSSSSRFTMLILAAAVAACQSPGPQPEAVATTSSIRGGALSREFAAAGFLVANGNLECTATLVAPDVILSAGHCLSSITAPGVELEFGIGADAAHRVVSVAVTAVDMAPNIDQTVSDDDEPDLAVAHLAEPITEVAPAVLYLGDADDLLGDTLRLIGYGADDVEPMTKKATGAGPRRAASVTVAELFPQLIGYNVEGMGACAGDSGGPAYVAFDNTYLQVGVNSFGDEQCLKVGRYQRLDIYRDWLATVGVPTTPRAVTCVEDNVCDGQCEADPDCVNLICPLGPDDQSCTPVSAATPAAPQTPETQTPEAPNPCATFTATPGTDGICYFKADDGTDCESEPIQTFNYDAAANRCTYITEQGQNCGSAEASVTLDQQDCVYVDPAGQECGRRPADCTSGECQC